MSSIKRCDHTSVGVLVHRDGRLLLIERARPPFGLAPPAGHVDESPSFDAAAGRELWEEVGLTAQSLRLLGEGRKDNRCRRPGGTWHYWRIYEAADPIGEIDRSPDETRRVVWASPAQLWGAAARSRAYLQGRVGQDEWERHPGLEPVWRDWLRDLAILSPGVQGGAP
jgi:ADP-ribose pyrophosphatase YjhB (NUDIX family)